MPKTEDHRPRPSSGQKGKPSAKRPAARKSAKSSRPFMPDWLGNGLSPERKIDILGVFLALVGLISFISLVSQSPGALSRWWVDLLFKGFGIAAFIFPLTLVGVGLWLIFRNVDRLPVLSVERLLGMVLFFFNLLAWLDLLVENWQPGQTYTGGGAFGGFFKNGLVMALGPGGTVVVLLAWLLIAISLTLDISIMDLMRFFKPIWIKLKRAWKLWASSREKARSVKQVPPTPSTELPATFRKLEPIAENNRTSKHPEAAPDRKTTTLAVRKPAENKTSSSQASSSVVVKTQALETPWKLPDLSQILEPPTPVEQQENFDQDTAKKIEETLASFGVPGHVVEIQHGPTVTQFGLEPDFIESRHGRTRVRVSKITSLADDLALALAAERIRIQAPVPGRNYVGIEVPNSEVSRVTLTEVMDSNSFKRLRSTLRFALGKNVSGKPVAVDMSALPHLLIAGTTGSGKSVCVNSILCSFLAMNSPADLRLVLVDPKRVELTGYNGIPHLLAPVVTEAERVINALQWMTREMDSRYHRFSKARVRNIQEFNLQNPAEKLPYLVVIIDELADLMMLAPDETERAITRLAQLARATGIHLILATQRPSTDVVTGLIKANFPARIAFAVASNVDSRVILDQPGAERLLGRGDMLYQAPDASGPVRLQGVYVSDQEITRIVDYWRDAALQASTLTPQTGEAVETYSNTADLPLGAPLKQGNLFDESEEEGDPLLNDAIDLVRREGRASITMLQRRMRIGYTRAARLVDNMEEKGIVSPVQPNTQVREVLDYGPTAPPPEDD